MDAGAAIRAARKNEGLSQAQLAERIGSTQPQVSAWERGKRSPKATDLDRIADALGRELRVSFERPRPASPLVGFDEVLGGGRGPVRKKRESG